MRTLTSALRATALQRSTCSQHHASAAPVAPLLHRRPGRLGAPAWRRQAAAAAAAVCGAAASYPGSGSDSEGSRPGGSGGVQAPPAAFNQLEALISQAFGGGGPGGDWKQVEECWVLYPPEGAEPKALVHFLGGAFVGAAPQLAYRPLLEALAARGALVVTTPYATSFDHVGAADEVYTKFQRCLKALGPSAILLPQFGTGHSFGSLLHLLINSRYVVPCTGNVFMSFNNRPATDSIPLLSPFIAPSIRALGPLLSQLATSPLRSNLEATLDMLKGVSPPLVKQVAPVLEQLTPIFLDVANSAQEFNPPPEETRNIIRKSYTVPRNLLIRFSNDTIDQTPELASTLQSSAIANSLELTVKTLPGEHVRPLQQDLNQISPELVRVANQAVTQSNDFLGQLTAFAGRAGLPSQAEEQLAGLAKAAMGVASMVGEAVLSTNAGDEIESLADELSRWMGLPAVPGKQTVLSLPPPPAAAAGAGAGAGAAPGTGAAGNGGSSSS